MDVDEIVKDCETDSEVEDCDEGSIMEAETMSELTELIDDEELPGGGRPFSFPMNHTTTKRTPSVFNQNSESSAAVARINLALSANKLLDEKLERMERVLLSRLNECRQKLKVVQSNDGTQNDKYAIFRYVNCGRPYFKDKQNFPAPDNEDAKMAKSQMYDFSLVTTAPGWTVRDKSQLVALIHKISIDIKKQELHNKITNLKRSNELKKDLEKQIMAIRKEIDKVSNWPLSKVALPLNEEYDWEMISNQLNRRHTAHEYQALWKLFFHPSISKNSWGTTEHTKLQKIALENCKQDWDKIARELNTGRSGYQCFVYYRTNVNSSFTGAKWTPEEVTYLRRLIEYYKEHNYIPWGKIAAAMENRTKIQIYNKYMRMIEQRKGRFLSEEDAVILNCVERFGTNFRRMTSFLPGRSMVQIRSRYQVLSKLRVSTVWTIEDDKKLVQLMSSPDATSSINFSTATQYFPGRNRTKIRSRYVTLVKWMKKHPHLGLEHAPRRGARRLNHGEASENLNDAVENLKNSLISSVKNRVKRKKLTEDSTHKDIGDAIMVLLVNCIVKEKEAESKREENIVLGPDHIVSWSDLNMTNLRKNIILLNAPLDKARYMESDYIKEYPTLGASSQDVLLVKVRSYSRKLSNQPIMITEPPNVWGTPLLFKGTRIFNSLSQRRYVLPPQLATITGTRSLLRYAYNSLSYYCENINLHVLGRRNIILKGCLEQAYDRFYVLFLWPLILSRVMPNETIEPNEQRTYSNLKVFTRTNNQPTLPTAPEVTINVKCIKKFKNKEFTEKIDLDEQSARKVVIAVEEKIDTIDGKIENLLC